MIQRVIACTVAADRVLLAEAVAALSALRAALVASSWVLKAVLVAEIKLCADRTWLCRKPAKDVAVALLCRAVSASTVAVARAVLVCCSTVVARVTATAVAVASACCSASNSLPVMNATAIMATPIARPSPATIDRPNSFMAAIVAGCAHA